MLDQPEASLKRPRHALSTLLADMVAVDEPTAVAHGQPLQLQLRKDRAGGGLAGVGDAGELPGGGVGGRRRAT